MYVFIFSPSPRSPGPFPAPPSDRFYQAAHPRPPASHPAALTSGVSKCPFRAALQAKSVHTTATDPTPKLAEKIAPPPPPPPPRQTEDESEAKAQGHCKCIAEGLKPKGKRNREE